MNRASQRDCPGGGSGGGRRSRWAPLGGPQRPWVWVRSGEKCSEVLPEDQGRGPHAGGSPTSPKKILEHLYSNGPFRYLEKGPEGELKSGDPGQSELRDAPHRQPFPGTREVTSCPRASAGHQAPPAVPSHWLPCVPACLRSPEPPPDPAKGQHNRAEPPQPNRNMSEEGNKN